MLITSTATLTYTQSGNIEPHEGSIALQIEPSWEPDHGDTHYLFQAGQAGGDRLELYKNSGTQMRFKVVAGGQSYEVSEVADLAAGAWGSIVGTWDDGGGTAHLYQNGEGTSSATVTNAVSGTLGIWVGSQAGGGSSVEGEVANLFIYDQTMSEAQADSLHRALLWTDILPGEEEYKTTSTITITYDYDPLYRLTSATYSAGAEYEYTYDAVGNRQSMTSPDGETSYTYDAANRLTSVGGVAYTWDHNGNLTSDGVRSYTYDHANRLTQVTQGSLTTQFAYNGDGVRTSKTVAGDSTEYALDLLATLPVVISDTDAVYLYGLDIIAQQQSERLYYVHDGLGSVRQLVDTTGQVQTTYAYDPFGVPVVEGDGSNPYQYTGEAWDAEVGLLYLRARYYQPEVGRFITKDPWPGDRLRPGTLNGYPYVCNNAANAVDPGGLDFLGPGAACPECTGGTGVGDAGVHLPAMPDMIMLLLPHESSLTWDPRAVYADWLNYQEHGYSRRASLGLAELLVASWFLPVPQEHYWFGPEHSLTQDVRNDPAMWWFRQQWARTDPPFRVPFSLPYQRDPQTGSLWAQLAGWTFFAQENLELGQCMLGGGSDTAAGPVDPVGGVLGSFDLIEVNWSGFGRVRFDVYNTMDRPSATRWPGTKDWVLDPVPRTLPSVLEGAWWGTTIYTHFYWEESYPLGHLLSGGQR